MAFYTYDSEADVLYVELRDEEEMVIDRTEELTPTIHVDLDAKGRVVGIEFLYPTHGLDPEPVRRRYKLDLQIPFRFAA